MCGGGNPFNNNNNKNELIPLNFNFKFIYTYSCFIHCFNIYKIRI